MNVNLTNIDTSAEIKWGFTTHLNRPISFRPNSGSISVNENPPERIHKATAQFLQGIRFSCINQAKCISFCMTESGENDRKA
jgi:hypothetical protein